MTFTDVRFTSLLAKKYLRRIVISLFYAVRINISLAIYCLKFSFKLVTFSKGYARKQSGCFFLNTVYTADHGGRDRGGQGGHGPSNNLVGGPYCIWPPQYFALEFKILTLHLMQREENMFRVPLCWMCVHCKIHYTY